MIRKGSLLFLVSLIIFSLSSCAKEKSPLPSTENALVFESETETESAHQVILGQEVEVETEQVTEYEVTEQEEIEATTQAESEFEKQEEIANEVIKPEEPKSEAEIDTETERETESEAERETQVELEPEREPETESEPEFEDIETEIPEEPVPEEPETEEVPDISHEIPVSEEWNLIVVNRWNKIPDNYSMELTELSNGHKVDSRIYGFLEAMIYAAKKENVYMFVRDGYRTNEEQRQLLEERIQLYLSQGYSRESAEKKAQEWVAVPGTSEHEIGLAVDINPDYSYGYTQNVYQWLGKNAHKYGFILRYPEGKEHITGIANEPWHYRYVGVEAATEIYQSGLCLEEYLLLR